MGVGSKSQVTCIKHTGFMYDTVQTALDFVA